MPRYERLETLVSMVLDLRAPGRGVSLDMMQERYDVGRRTAERMRDAVARLFPELDFELGYDGKRYWKLPRATRDPLLSWTPGEVAAIERAVVAAERAGAPETAALASIAAKIRISSGEPAPCRKGTLERVNGASRELS